MGKIKVSGKILIDDIDIDLWGEPAKSNDKRSNIKFNSSNKDLEITNTNYNKHYVTVHNSTMQSKEKDIDVNNYQRPHSLYLGHLSKKHIWLVEKGCRPLLSNATFTKSYTTAGTYKLSYDASKAITNLTLPDNSVVVIPYTIFNLLVTGAGGGGKGGYYSVDYYVVWGAQKVSSGAAGGCGASHFCTLDMSIVKNVTIILGAGGAGSKGSDYASNGGSSKITAGSASADIAGGAAGKEDAYADVSSVDWNFDFTYRDDAGGKGGGKPSLLKGAGIFNSKSFSGNTRSTSQHVSISDSYGFTSNSISVSFSSKGAAVGGKAGSYPSKPGLNKTNRSTGGNGKNGGLFIWY